MSNFWWDLIFSGKIPLARLNHSRAASVLTGVDIASGFEH